jgi:predicted nucleic acid-binding protein
VTACPLDTSVLIALIDPAHVHRDAVHRWFAHTGRKRFATCPITDNGLPRVVGHPGHPNAPGPPNAIAPALAALRSLAVSRGDRKALEPI